MRFCTLLLLAGAGEALLGKCPEGHEAVFDTRTEKVECSCLPYHLYWPLDGICYREMSRGPCKQGFKVVWNPVLEAAECQCPTFWSLGPDDGLCYEEYTQGPCLKGKLLINGLCQCSQNMTMHFHPETGQCFQLYTDGPCSSGQMLQFDYHLLRPECVCKKDHLQWSDGNCYLENSQGPCSADECTEKVCSFRKHCCGDCKTCDSLFPLISHLSRALLMISIPCTPGAPVCRLIRRLLTADATGVTTKALATTGNGSSTSQTQRKQNAHRSRSFAFLLATLFSHKSKPSTFQCLMQEQECKRFDNWYMWTDDGTCYKQYSQGPCQLGELFYLDSDTGKTSCECRRDWQPYYYPVDGKCYEHDTRASCPTGRYFTYNTATNKTECVCFSDFVARSSAPDSDQDGGHEECVEKLTQSTCPLGQLVTRNEHDGSLKCDCHASMEQNFWPYDGLCYEHFTQGPCHEPDHVFRLDLITGLPDCLPPIGRRRRK